MKPRSLFVGFSLAVALLAIAIGAWCLLMSEPAQNRTEVRIGGIWQRIRETYASLAGGPDWGTWIMHASIGALFGYFHQPLCATLFYGLRELEQGTLKDDWRARWLDHLMDWVAPTAAAFAMARWG